jgi:hypothetical protein
LIEFLFFELDGAEKLLKMYGGGPARCLNAGKVRDYRRRKQHGRARQTRHGYQSGAHGRVQNASPDRRGGQTAGAERNWTEQFSANRQLALSHNVYALELAPER